MKQVIILSLLLTSTIIAWAQVPISQIEGLLEVYLADDTTSLYIGKGAGRLHNGNLRSNIVVGHGAGYSITSGRENCFFGRSAGNSITTGFENSFFGLSAGYSNISGFSNSIFGKNAGYSSTTGNANSFFGRSAGYSNISGNSNSFFGINAGYHITGSNNLCLGESAGPSFGSRNVSNRLYINFGESNTPLIYGEFDNNLVQINGRLTTGEPGQDNVLLTLSSERSWVFKQYDAGSSTALKLTGADPGNNNKDLLIDTEGNVGIGTDAPAYKLHVNGDAGKPGGGSWSNASDRRLKTNIIDFTEGLSIVQAVRPVSFRYNGLLDLPTEETYVGVIAQELQAIAPEMVKAFTGSDGNSYLNVDPSAFDFILINAVREQQKMIENQQVLLDEVRAENETMLSRQTYQDKMIQLLFQTQQALTAQLDKLKQPIGSEQITFTTIK
ncbi:MAG: tail fiber domain-containing protein [Saprospiraceae bacterium]|nr:tail fiber domain-containing protein [Saprospiraceae bacterium]